jgi:ABC-type sugar transport system substrate-binding protein
MSLHLTTRPRRTLMAGGALLAAGVVLAGCTSNETPVDDASDAAGGGDTAAEGGSSNDEPGETVVIGFSGPQADHGWLAAINSAAEEEAAKYDDVDFRMAEGTNDASLQISQIETFINDGVDAIVLLPTDGAALTEVAIQAMEAGIPVINVDREFSSPFAARTTVLGDNYGMGVSAGTYACGLVEENSISDPVIAEIAGIDALPLTQDRSRGFADALEACGETVDNRVAAEFTVESGEEVAPTCSRPPRRSTSSGTTTTTRASASRPPSTTPAATSSSSSAAPARPTPCGGSRTARWRPRSSTRRRRPPTASGSRA